MSAPASAPVITTRDSFTRPPFPWPRGYGPPKRVPLSGRRIDELQLLPIEEQRQRYPIPSVLVGAARRVLSQADEPRVLRRHVVFAQHVCPHDPGAPAGQAEPFS